MTGERKATTKAGPGYKQWKPSLTEDGKTKVYNIRFLPYQDQNEQPFQEVAFYDDKAFTQWRLVAPAQFGLQDPVAELVTELRKDRKNSSAWKVIKPLLPKPRFFAPILVREEEKEGVQIWELSPTMCKELFSIFVSEDYRDEDVTDPNSGHDFQITVSASGKTFTPPGSNKSYPVNDVKPLIRAKKTKLLANAEEAQKLIDSIPNLVQIFKSQCKSSSELETLLENYLAQPTSSGQPVEDKEEKPEEPSDTADSIAAQFAGL